MTREEWISLGLYGSRFQSQPLYDRLEVLGTEPRGYSLVGDRSRTYWMKITLGHFDTREEAEVVATILRMIFSL